MGMLKSFNSILSLQFHSNSLCHSSPYQITPVIIDEIEGTIIIKYFSSISTSFDRSVHSFLSSIMERSGCSGRPYDSRVSVRHSLPPCVYDRRTPAPRHFVSLRLMEKITNKNPISFISLPSPILASCEPNVSEVDTPRVIRERKYVT